GSSSSSCAHRDNQTSCDGDNSYNGVRNAMIRDARSSADWTAVASLPSIDPTGGRPELMSTAEAKAFGLLSYNGTDGCVGLDKTASWRFDPSSRTVSGTFDCGGVV